MRKARGMQNGKRSGTAAAMLLAGAVSVLALPSAVLAFSSRFDPLPSTEGQQAAKPGGFQPAEVDPRLARSITVRALAKGQAFRFTPAVTPNRLERSVTVAVRFDGRNQRPIVVTGPLAAAEPVAGGSSLRIAPTAYSLGATRGYKGFGQSGASQSANRKPELPDLSSYQLSGSTAQDDPSRFAPRIALDEKEKAGRSPRTFEGESDQSVDLGGSYRLTRNLNVTAGVRYQTERDRLVPLTDGKKDSQAVYVGTQFRF